MSDINWTREQQLAIEGRQGGLLLNAAAGSGKTAVLVERVVKLLTDTENPCSPEELLIVTFTRAAAAQMRERISRRLSQLIAEQPTNTFLLQRQMLLPNAKICTIDSFCSDLVRENFHALGLTSDITLADESDAKAMQTAAVNNVLDELFESENEDFLKLADILGSARSDGILADAIRDIFLHVSAYPFPERRLAELAGEYTHQKPFESTHAHSVIRARAAQSVDYCLEVTNAAIELVKKDVNVAAYAAVFGNDAAELAGLAQAVEFDGWDELFEKVQTFKLTTRMPAIRGYESEIKSMAGEMRDRVKKILKRLPNLVNATTSACNEDMSELAAPACMLIECVGRFIGEYSRLKSEANSVDFNDILHYALSLLVTCGEDGTVSKTPLANELSGGLREILVDEYQDTNLAQDMLFTALSRDERNLFFVGDVKQSIYRFRQAMPEIFLSRRDGLPEFDGETYPAKINLDRNFRSRSGVTSAVNYAFERLMSAGCGGLDYGDGERLVPAADFEPHKRADAELHVLDIGERSEETDEMSTDELEAEYVASMIKRIVDGGETVKGKNGERRACYGDFCILLQAASNGRAAAYLEKLKKEGIPACAQLGGKLFGSREMGIVLSLLKVVNNSVQDVPLTAVLLSPVFGFSPDEIAEIRLANCDKNASIYACVVFAAQNGSKRCADFLAKIKALRTLSSTLCAADLVRRVVDETGITAISAAMRDGEQRKANLHMLLELANRFDAIGGCGLSAFLRFIEASKGFDSAGAAGMTEDANVVRIMSIHKSKGLEFPFCILAGTSHSFNDSDQRKNVIVGTSGMGMVRKDERYGRRFKTLMLIAAAEEEKYASRSEALRVLYVAMTRAKERLICVSAMGNPQGKIAKLAALDTGGVKLSPFAVREATSLSDWLLLSFLRHPDSEPLKRLGNVDVSTVPADFRLDVVCTSPQGAQQEEIAACKAHELDKELLSVIETRLSFAYPYGPLEIAGALRTASEIDTVEKNEYFASARPAFMSARELTPAQRGTAVHRFMQLFRPDKSEGVRQQLQRLAGEGKFSSAELAAMPVAELEGFFESPLFERICNAEAVYKEKKFAFLVPVTSLYPQLDESFAGERVMIRGMIDCVFVEKGRAVIVDYKTDRNALPQQLLERHASQLRIYARAVGECMGLSVGECLIYSLPLKRSIDVPLE